MKFLSVLLLLLIMGTVLASGIVLAANGTPWLLIAGLASFIALFVRFGCVQH